MSTSHKSSNHKHAEHVVIRIVTFFIWLVFLAALLWSVFILFWLLAAFLLPQYVYVPLGIRSSTTVLMLLLCWTSLVSLTFYYLSKKNKSHVINEVAVSDDANQLYSWTEIISNPSDVHPVQLVKQRLLSAEELELLSPSKALSYGITLYHQGMINEAIGIFRLVIEREDSSPLLIEIAQLRLNQLLPYSGSLGNQILNKLEEGEMSCS